MKHTESNEERVEKALQNVQDAFDRYASLPRKDQDLGLLYDLTSLLHAQATQPDRIADEHEAMALGDRQYYVTHFYEARQNIITRLVDAAASIARNYPSRVSTMFVEEEYTSVATQILKDIDYVKVNTRADLLVKYAHLIDQESTVENRAPGTREAEKTVVRHKRLLTAAKQVVSTPTSKKAKDSLAAALEELEN